MGNLDDVSFINTSRALLITKITTLSPLDSATIPNLMAFHTVSTSPELIIIPISGVRDLLKAATFSQPENCAFPFIPEKRIKAKIMMSFLINIYFLLLIKPEKNFFPDSRFTSKHVL
jgi:hypothetical protein